MSGLVRVLLFGVGSGSGIKLSGSSPSGFGAPNTSLLCKAFKINHHQYFLLFGKFTIIPRISNFNNSPFQLIDISECIFSRNSITILIIHI